MFFKKRKEKSEQRGTLMVEAIAMLGLIAMVTPTLYKKSAERLQEIQDINIASQARTMSQIIETFVRNNTTAFRDLTSDSSKTTVIEICKNSSCSGQSDYLDVHLKEGYSSAIPYGFKPDEIKNFGEPRVFAVAEDGSVVFYIVYPTKSANNNIGKKRTSRLASLIGANGGFVETASSHITGTGGAWELDSSMIDEFKLPKDLLIENSLVITNNEPIMTKMDDTDTYLYRVPPGEIEEFYHNTMITDLYLGGNQVEDSDDSKEFHSIFNVRKMTMNTRCSAHYIYGASSSIDSSYCDPDVADLYVGKPHGFFRQDPQKAVGVEGGGNKNYGANTGAAWIYGNFAALSDRFKVFHTQYDEAATEYERRGHDILQFSRLDSSVSTWDGLTSDQELSVLAASNESSKAYVSMMNGLVRVVEDGEWGASSGHAPAFLVGGANSSDAVGDGRLVAAYETAAGGVVHINSLHNADGITRINDYGGNVYINGDNSSSEELNANTYINQGGGVLQAGKNAQWFSGTGVDDSARVDILYANESGVLGQHFSVGGVGATHELVAKEHMIYADSTVTTLRDGAIRAYKANKTFGNLGGTGAIDEYGGDSSGVLENGAVIAAKYTDILGPTYLGTESQMKATIDDSSFVRDNWQLGVAGSAWVDKLLFANDAWFNSSGVKELHAGFSSFAEYQRSPRKGWLNAYHDGVVINNREAAGDTSSGVGGVHADYTRFFADDKLVYMGDSGGAMARLEDGIAKFGYTDISSGLPEPINYVGADSSAAFVVGDELAQIYTVSNDINNSSVAVDIQKGAMLFEGHSWTDDTRSEHLYGNNIAAHAGVFTVQTDKIIGKDEDGNTVEGTGPGAAMLYADAGEVHTRFVDFKVQSNSSENILHVRPNEDAFSSSGEANVTVNGSFHVTGNDVVHIANNNDQTSDKIDEQHATFEIDPQFVRVMARNGATSSSFITQGGDKLAMFEVNSYDIDGSSSADANSGSDPTERASVYVRRGAIELEKNPKDYSSAADAGFGYIKANRFVSNVEGLTIPNAPGQMSDGHYDQYMVNPAYTSVMHDIKLTTRGGARLSDILPDYVLKGVYNVSNDYIEGTSKQICWSSGNKSGCEHTNIAWADSYVGILPYAICPPGYKNMATIIPTSFQMAQAGDIVKATAYPGGRQNNAYVVNPAGSRQARILSAAGTNANFVYPRVVRSVSLHVNEAYKSSETFDVKDLYKERTEGWFYGYEAVRQNDTDPTADTVSNLITIGPDNDRKAYMYSSGNVASETGYVPEPLYFQQNTYLKTSLNPLSITSGSASNPSGWEARMGFIYDKGDYGLGDGLGNAGILSQNAPEGFNEGETSINYPFDVPGDWVWNLFPVATNSIEGHATVYCYFDRKEFKGAWSSLVDDIDQLNSYRLPKSDEAKSDSYKTRLNDPSLKYTNPW